MDIKKRTLALLLAFCILTVPACSEKTADSAEDSAKTSSEITSLTGENEELPDASEEPDPLATPFPKKTWAAGRSACPFSATKGSARRRMPKK